MTDLEPLGPEEAVELYVENRRTELSEKSLQNHKYRLNTFTEFCEERGIEDLNNLSSRDLNKYRAWRREDDITTITLRSNLATLRVFLEFCARIDGVSEGMRERVVLPEVEPEEEARDVKLNEDRAGTVLDYLDRFEYASREHVVVGILWHTGIRLGALRAFDVNDFDADAKCLELRHRPGSGTPLKNGQAAQRSIAVGDYWVDVLEDYIQYHRHNVEDKHGRRPLITSQYGRLSESPIRETVYRWTRPCVVGEECPHDRDPDTCEAMTTKTANECPSSRSPHGIRRGAITKTLRDGTPEAVVSERMNVSPEILDQHYDRRSEREKMELRREHLRDA